MKSKLVLNICLAMVVLSGITIHAASATMSRAESILFTLQWIDKVKLDDIKNLKVSIGPYGSSWTFESKSPNGCQISRCVSQAKVEQIIPQQAVRWMLNNAKSNTDKTSTGIDLHQRILKFKNKYTGSSFNKPKKDYSSLLGSLKTKVTPTAQVLGLAHQEGRFYAKMAQSLHDKALSASALHQIALEDAHGQAWTSFAQEATAKAKSTTTGVGSKVAQFAAHPTTQYTAFATGALVAGTAIAGASAYGAQKAYSYMYPTPTQTPFESAKSALKDGYNSSVTFVKAHQKPIGAAAATITILGLGYAAYKNRHAIFGKSIDVTAPLASKTSAL